MNFKRITIICGHYGSGKTNVAVNLAFALKKLYDIVAVADIDIVNPYYRAADSAGELREAGIRLITSEYANSNVDLPALPQDIYAVTDDRNIRAVLDIGGDERGALALGRLAKAVKAENGYDMLFVVSKFRPLTRDAASATEVMREIENACGIAFTGIINNSNLGAETTADDVLGSAEYAEEVAARAGLKVRMTAVDERLIKELDGKLPNLFPLKLQRKNI